MRWKRAALTRAQSKAKGFVRAQQANAGTAARRVPGHVLGPQNTHWAELEGGVNRPSWLTPKKPNWVSKAFRFGKYGGFAGLVGGTAYGLLSGNDTPKLRSKKPLKGYLDKLYPKMAPIRRRIVRTRKRRVHIVKRRYRKRAPMRRRMGRRRSRRGKKSPLLRAIRRSSKRIKMGHYTSEKKYDRCCDSIFLGDYSPLFFNAGPGLLDTEKTFAAAKYYPLQFTVANLPVLQSLLGTGYDKFNEFKIDKVTFKIKILNARAMQMDPNYRAPDGTGQTAATGTVGGFNSMLNQQDYVTNTYVFHKRWQNDVENDQDFLDWRKCLVGQKGACTFVNLFKQAGKMFNTGITADRADTMYIQNVLTNTKKYGQPIGFQRVNEINNLRIGQGGLILPGMTRTGWDNTQANVIPKIRVTARVCSTVRFNANGVDQI